jgi:hypothetical protein
MKLFDGNEISKESHLLSHKREKNNKNDFNFEAELTVTTSQL